MEIRKYSVFFTDGTGCLVKAIHLDNAVGIALSNNPGKKLRWAKSNF